jgi:hypothetical protein
MNNSIKNVFDEFIRSFEKEKILIVDNYVFKILKNIYTKNDFINNMVIDVISIESDFTKELKYPLIFILNDIPLNIESIPNKKNIFVLNNYSNSIEIKKNVNTFGQIQLDFQVVLPNLIYGITNENIKSILNNSHKIIHFNLINLDYLIENKSTEKVIISIRNEHTIELINTWSYFHLLYKYDIFTEKDIESSKSDPYYEILWNKKYEEVIIFIKNEILKYKDISTNALNYKEMQYKNKYIKLHNEYISKLESILKEKNIFEKSLEENKMFQREIQNDFLKNPFNKTKTDDISDYYIYTKRKNSLKNNIKKIIKDNIFKDKKIYVLTDKISIEEAVEMSELNCIILCTDSFQKDIYLNYNTKSISNEHKFKINYISKIKSHSEKIIHYQYIQDYIDELKQLESNIFKREQNLIDTISLKITSSIKSEFSILDMKSIESQFKFKELENLTKNYKKIMKIDKEITDFDNQIKMENSGENSLLMETTFDNTYEMERERQIIQLENDIMQLNELFLDINLLINNQTSMLESIEMNVIRAEEHIENGVVELSKAETYQKKSINKLKYIAGTLLAVGGILGLGLGLKFR